MFVNRQRREAEGHTFGLVGFGFGGAGHPRGSPSVPPNSFVMGRELCCPPGFTVGHFLPGSQSVLCGPCVQVAHLVPFVEKARGEVYTFPENFERGQASGVCGRRSRSSGFLPLLCFFLGGGGVGGGACVIPSFFAFRSGKNSYKGSWKMRPAKSKDF